MDTFLKILTAIGIPAIIIAFIYIGRKLQILDNLVLTIDKMKSNLNTVCNYLIKNLEFDSSEIQTYSPMQLTEAGLALIKKLGFDNIFEQNKDDFFNFIDMEKPKLKYDVEMSAIKSIMVMGDKEYMNFLKVFFYSSPKRNLENTAPTLGIYVRDKYLERHPEITQ